MEEKGEYSHIKKTKLPLGTFGRGSFGAVHGAFEGDVEKKGMEREREGAGWRETDAE